MTFQITPAHISQSSFRHPSRPPPPRHFSQEQLLHDPLSVWGELFFVMNSNGWRQEKFFFVYCVTRLRGEGVCSADTLNRVRVRFHNFVRMFSNKKTREFFLTSISDRINSKYFRVSFLFGTTTVSSRSRKCAEKMPLFLATPIGSVVTAVTSA